MKLKSYSRRLLTMVLAAAMLVGMIPAAAPSVVPKAEAATTAGYISLPITIRDYADDGMLFEFNELARTSNPTDAAILHGNGVLVDPTYTITGQATVAGGSATSTNGYYKYTTNTVGQNMVLTYPIDTSALTYNNRLDDFRYMVITYAISGTMAPVITLTDNEGNTYVGTAVSGSEGTDGSLNRIMYDFGENVNLSGVITSLTIDTGASAGGTAETVNTAASTFGKNNETASGVVTFSTGLYTSPDKATQLEVYVEVTQTRDESSTAASSFGSNNETASGVVNSNTGVYGLVNGEYVPLSAYVTVTASREESDATASGDKTETADGVVSESTGVYYDAGNGNYVELHLYCNYTAESTSGSGCTQTTTPASWKYYYVIPGQTTEYTGTKYTANYTYSRSYSYVTADGTAYTGTTYAATYSPVRNYYYRIPGQTAAYNGALYTGNFNTTGENSSLSVSKIEFFEQTDRDIALFRSSETASLGIAYLDTDKTKISYYSTNKNNGNFGMLWSHRISYTDPMTASDAAVYFYNVNTNLMDYKTGSGYNPTSGYTSQSKSIMPNTEYYRFGDYNRSGYYTGLNANGYIDMTLQNGVVQELMAGTMRSNLVSATLGDNKELVYNEDTVDYWAYVLNIGLKAEMFQPDGNNVERREFAYIIGTKVVQDEHGYGTMDMATAIRRQLGSNPDNWTMGTYADAKAKHAAGGLNDYTGIATVYDAAYFLLHNLYEDSNGYGTTVDKYNTLRMSNVGTDANGNSVYRFDSHYGVDYGDTNAGVISNTDTTSVDKEFNPLYGLGYGQTGSYYIDWSADPNADKYDQYNFNYTMEGHAKFIYYHDDNLYFKFSGDDDVYLFINGKLVLDLGAAHGTTEGRIYLNNVADLCGLEDGEPYDFDFYYMERHGHAADFSIETNIQIVDPAMLTQKTGYQNGVEVGYNGYVDSLLPVNYSFQLTNNGEAPLKNLEFKDEDIGVSLTPDAIKLNGETTYDDLLIAVYHTDGTYNYYPKGQVTEAILKEVLTTGLAVGERIIIHGFKYTPSKYEKWVEDGDTSYFHNTLQTTATVESQNSTTETLNGVANYRVRKHSIHHPGDHFYTVGKLASGDDTVKLAESSSITGGITEEEILAMIQAGIKLDGTTVGTAVTSYDSVKICSASGNTAANLNTKATVNGKTITYTTKTTGTDSFYFLAYVGNKAYGPIRVTVFNYGYADNVYVLDYSLPVELNGVNFGLTVNDALSVDNPYIASTALSVPDPATDTTNITQNYGTFAVSTEDDVGETCYGGVSLKYTMNDFMDGVDFANVTVTLAESGVTTPDNRTNGVYFTEKVEVVPASVVYYEDDFAGITYVNSTTDSAGNVWAEYVGSEGSGTEQSADQESNYGSDPNYTDDTKWGTLQLDQDQLQSDILSIMGYADETWNTFKDAILAIDSENGQKLIDKIEAAFEKYTEKLDGTASNGTIHELILSPGTGKSEIMYFDFQGTGFELISRATQDLYAVLTVRVTEGTVAEDGTFTKGDTNNDGVITTKAVPVITESEGGDVYEVPIIKIEGLPYGHYKVSLTAANTSDANREIYIDGIRIYNPLGTDDQLTDVYYAADEEDAVFFEIRPLIVTDEKIVYLDLNKGTITWGTGTTVVEDLGNDETDSIFQAATSGTTDYLQFGPNNEIYLDATADGITGGQNVSLLAFYVTKDTAVADENRTLQIGAQRKIDTDQVTNLTDGVSETEAGAVYFVYGSTAADIADGIEVDGATVNYLPLQSGTEQYITIDPANLDFDENGKALVLVGTMGGENAAANVLALTNLKISGYTLSACGEEIVNAVNGTSATMLLSTGYSLRRMMSAPVETTPEETIPEETVPEETVPEETVPEETVPEETIPEETVPEETVPEETVPEETVPEETTPAVNEDLTVNSASFASKRVKSGSTAVLTVTTSAGADSLLILDEDGNEVAFTIVSTVSASDSGIKGWFAKFFGAILGGSSDGTTYTVSLTVEGDSGEQKSYTVYALDPDGARSGNSQTASIKIR